MRQIFRTRPWPTSAASKKKKNSKGFTLVEIAIAITILALGTTLVVVYLDALLPQSKVQAAARTLAAQIADLRSTAITQGYVYQIEYDLSHDRYRVITPFKGTGGLALKPEDRIKFEWVDMPEKVKLKNVIIGGGDPIETGSVFIEFDPLGTSIEHDVHLFLEHLEIDLTLHVDGLTGLVRFYSGKPQIVKVTDADFR